MRAALRQAWELDDAEKAERLIRNLARRLEQVAPGVAASILEGLDEMLTVIRLGLPAAASLAGLHQHHREHDGHHPARLPQRQTLARCINGTALDRSGNAGGNQGLSAIEGTQAAAAAPCGTRCPSRKHAVTPCLNPMSLPLNLPIWQCPRRLFQQRTGHPPEARPTRYPLGSQGKPRRQPDPRGQGDRKWQPSARLPDRQGPGPHLRGGEVLNGSTARGRFVRGGQYSAPLTPDTVGGADLD